MSRCPCVRTVLSAFLGAALLALPCAGLADKPECYTGEPVPNFAANCPDAFAWRKFVEVNSPAPGYDGIVVWQTYATDPDTFPAKPQPARCRESNPPADACPTWPESPAHHERLVPSKRNDDLHPASRAHRTLRAAKGRTGVPRDLGAIAGETIRRNRVSFDYIVENHLWFQEGLAAQFDANFVIDFPLKSIELKFNWLPLTHGEDPSRYYTVEMDGVLNGLVAMHVTTKDLPNWFWATFEHVDNPGRCDFLGCHDSFGVEPANVAPRQVLRTDYPPGRLRPALVAMMEDAGMDPVFMNYRLKGSQIDFTDSHGEPTLVGNSVTEYGFVPTASCITCHGRAGVDWNGQKPANLRIFGEKLGGQTFNGPLDPELFYDRNDPTRRYIMQVDFIWAIPFRAQPIGGQSSSGDD